MKETVMSISPAVIATVVVGLVAVIGGIITAMVWRKIQKFQTGKEVATLTMSDIKEFFKKTEIATLIRNNPNYVGVVIRQVLKDGRTRFSLTVFDRKNNELLHEKSLPTEMKKSDLVTIYTVSAPDASLNELFGDKDLLILE